MNEKGRPKSWEREQWRYHFRSTKLGEWFFIPPVKPGVVRAAAADLGLLLLTQKHWGRTFGVLVNGKVGARTSHFLTWGQKVTIHPNGKIELGPPTSENKPPGAKNSS